MRKDDYVVEFAIETTDDNSEDVYVFYRPKNEELPFLKRLFNKWIMLDNPFGENGSNAFTLEYATELTTKLRTVKDVEDFINQ